jgi:hypothetical protein
MPFSKSTSIDAGRKGGQARSVRKTQAARLNAGKRKRELSIDEKIMGRKLTFWEKQVLNSDKGGKLRFMFGGELQKLNEFFKESKVGDMPREIRYLVGKFRLGAQHFMEEAKLASAARYETWDRKNRKLPNYRLIVDAFAKDPTMTPQEVEKLGGSAYAPKKSGRSSIAEGILKNLGQKIPLKKNKLFLSVHLDSEHAQKFQEIKEFVKVSNLAVVQGWIRETHQEMLKEKANAEHV